MTSGETAGPDPRESPGTVRDIVDPDTLALAEAAIDSPLTAAELCRVVGSRVRELRRELNMTMSSFATEAEISLGMLSKIEHGQSAPSLSTLVRLATTAKVPVTALFRGLDEEHDLVIVRAGEGHEIHHDRGGHDRLYQDLGALRGPNRVIEPMITTIAEPGGVFPLYQHPGVEFLHVLEGSLYYGYGGKAYLLNTGDTMQIHGEVAHGPVELVELPIRFISIKVYPANEPRAPAGG
ncbi:helix-turn-helix domain-containing protein [Candidatus Poriferisodalis sp.]|uniref:helix-turn-helix domain-containing protein n=1 Tax=Candidatus Poriferisodalis sp. TaxID=3101277 RepID=UPI003D0D76C1